MSAASLVSYVIGKLKSDEAAAGDMSGGGRSPHKPQLTTVWRTKSIPYNIPDTSHPFRNEGSFLKLLRTKSMPQLGREGSSPQRLQVAPQQAHAAARSQSPSPVRLPRVENVRNMSDHFSDASESTAPSMATPPPTPRSPSPTRPRSRSASDGHLWQRRKKQMRRHTDKVTVTLPSVKDLRGKFDDKAVVSPKEKQPPVSPAPVDDHARREGEAGNEREGRRVARHYSMVRPHLKSPERRQPLRQAVTPDNVRKILEKIEISPQMEGEEGEVFSRSDSQELRTKSRSDTTLKTSASGVPKEDQTHRRTSIQGRQKMKNHRRSKSEPDPSAVQRHHAQTSPPSVRKLKLLFEREARAGSGIDYTKSAAPERNTSLERHKEKTPEPPQARESVGKTAGETVAEESSAADQHLLGVEDATGQRQQQQQHKTPPIVEVLVAGTPSVRSLRQRFEKGASVQSSLKTAEEEVTSRPRRAFVRQLKTPFEESLHQKSRSMSPEKESRHSLTSFSSASVKNLTRQFEALSPEVPYQAEQDTLGREPMLPSSPPPTDTHRNLQTLLVDSETREARHQAKPASIPIVEVQDGSYWRQQSRRSSSESSSDDEKREEENRRQEMERQRIEQEQKWLQEAKEKEEKERRIQEILEKEREAKKKLEEERRLREREEQERLAREEKIKLLEEKRKEKEKAELEIRKKEKEEKERKEREREENERKEREREENERKERERIQKERKEREKLKKEMEEKAEMERRERERMEREKTKEEEEKREREEVERLLHEQQESARKRREEFMRKLSGEEVAKSAERDDGSENDKKTDNKPSVSRSNSSSSTTPQGEASSEPRVEQLIDQFTNLRDADLEGEARRGDAHHSRLGGDDLEDEDMDGRRHSDVAALVNKFRKLNARRGSSPSSESDGEESSKPRSKSVKEEAPIPTIPARSSGPGKTRTLREDEMRFFESAGGGTEPFLRTQSLRVKKSEQSHFTQPRFGSLRGSKSKSRVAVLSTSTTTTAALPQNCRRLNSDELQFFTGEVTNIYRNRTTKSRGRAGKTHKVDGRPPKAPRGGALPDTEEFFRIAGRAEQGGEPNGRPATSENDSDSEPSVLRAGDDVITDSESDIYELDINLRSDADTEDPSDAEDRTDLDQTLSLFVHSIQGELLPPVASEGSGEGPSRCYVVFSPETHPWSSEDEDYTLESPLASTTLTENVHTPVLKENGISLLVQQREGTLGDAPQALELNTPTGNTNTEHTSHTHTDNTPHPPRQHYTTGEDANSSHGLDLPPRTKENGGGIDFLGGTKAELRPSEELKGLVLTGVVTGVTGVTGETGSRDAASHLLTAEKRHSREEKNAGKKEGDNVKKMEKEDISIKVEETNEKMERKEEANVKEEDDNVTKTKKKKEEVNENKVKTEATMQKKDITEAKKKEGEEEVTVRKTEKQEKEITTRRVNPQQTEPAKKVNPKESYPEDLDQDAIAAFLEELDRINSRPRTIPKPPTHQKETTTKKVNPQESNPEDLDQDAIAAFHEELDRINSRPRIIPKPPTHSTPQKEITTKKQGSYQEDLDTDAIAAFLGELDRINSPPRTIPKLPTRRKENQLKHMDEDDTSSVTNSDDDDEDNTEMLPENLRSIEEQIIPSASFQEHLSCPEGPSGSLRCHNDPSRTKDPSQDSTASTRTAKDLFIAPTPSGTQESVTITSLKDTQRKEEKGHVGEESHVSPLPPQCTERQEEEKWGERDAASEENTLSPSEDIMTGREFIKFCIFSLWFSIVIYFFSDVLS